MKVLLVYCNSMLENALPIGLSQLSACLKEAGITVELFDTTFYRYGPKSGMENRIEALQFPPCELHFNKGNMEDEFRLTLNRFQPDLVGLSVVEPTFLLGMKLLESARDIIKKNNIKVALGGVHAIFAPESALKYDFIDYICISEGEHAFVDLCLKISQGKTIERSAGFWVKNVSGWVKNTKAPLVDINNLPIMDFTIFPDSYLKKPMMGKSYRTISIATTRGCPYRCSYCGDKALTNLFKEMGPWYRQKRIGRIEEELKEYIKTYTPEFVYIISESFLSGSLSRVKEFADIYKPLAIPFWFCTRPEDITEEKVKLIKEIGCMRVSIGLEHGNEVFRKKFLYRSYTNATFIKACRILKNFEISFSVNIILGLPHDTREMVFEAIEILREVKPDGVSAHIFNPYRGSEIRELCIKEGMIASELIAEDHFQLDYVLDNPSISKLQVLGLFRTLPLYIELDKDKYPLIEMAEKSGSEGDKAFETLKNQFYALKGWSK